MDKILICKLNNLDIILNFDKIYKAPEFLINYQYLFKT